MNEILGQDSNTRRDGMCTSSFNHTLLKYNKLNPGSVLFWNYNY